MVLSSGIPILQQFDEAAVDLNDNNAKYIDNSKDKYIHIQLEDIQEEIEFWSSSIVCFVIGANPPVQVMEGFF